MNTKKTVLLVTDFYYEAKGREYFREDVELSGFLRKYFTVCLAHIADLDKVVDHVDAVLLRNTGPQMLHQAALQALRSRPGLVLYNDLLGSGDIKGKHHLLELYRLGYPVIPSFTSKKELSGLSPCTHYLIKPLDGADSCGVSVVSNDELRDSYPNALIQPLMDFEYEVSFYFVDKQFYYALYAPNREKRWELAPYTATEQDKEFALACVNWNTSKHGIERVDACRLKDGTLLLMELEDYNPFLSLDLLSPDLKVKFTEGLCHSLAKIMGGV